MPTAKKLTAPLNLQLGRAIREVDIRTYSILTFVVRMRIIL